jgi:transposase
MTRRSQHYPPELRGRAVRMVAEVIPNNDLQWAAINAVVQKLGVGTGETVRKWVRQAEAAAGHRPGATSEESAEIKRLKREVAELRRANETSHAVILSSGAGVRGVRGDREGGRFVVGLAGVQAVVQAAQEPVDEERRGRRTGRERPTSALRAALRAVFGAGTSAAWPRSPVLAIWSSPSPGP